MKMKLIAKGAEADVLLKMRKNGKVVVKKRVPKKYRVGKLDETIRRVRNRHEIRLMEKAFNAGVPVPRVLKKGVFFFEMEFVDGEKLRDVLNEGNYESLAIELGKVVAKLHNAGIIHGDITTSNVIVDKKSGKLVLIDFGLGFFSTSAEDMATDVHVLEETSRATHATIASGFLKAFFDSYFDVLDSKKRYAVKKRLESIRKRGRYVKKSAT